MRGSPSGRGPVERSKEHLLLTTAEGVPARSYRWLDGLAVPGRARQLMLESLMKRRQSCRHRVEPIARWRWPFQRVDADAQRPGRPRQAGVGAGAEQALLVELLRRQEGATIAAAQ